MFSKKFVTLNIEASSIRGLIADGKKIELWESIPLQSGIVRDGIVLEQEALGQAIDALFGRMNAPREFGKLWPTVEFKSTMLWAIDQENTDDRRSKNTDDRI